MKCYLSISQSPVIQTDLQHIVTRGQTTNWPMRKSASRVRGKYLVSLMLRTFLPRVSATCFTIWNLMTLMTFLQQLMDEHPELGHDRRLWNIMEVDYSTITSFSSFWTNLILTWPCRTWNYAILLNLENNIIISYFWSTTTLTSESNYQIV